VYAEGNSYQLKFSALDVRDIHVVGRGGQVFQLLAGEDVDGDQVDLGVTVLASLGGGHVDDLAGTALDDDEAVLPQGRALHGVSERGASIGGLEGVLMLVGVSLSPRWNSRGVGRYTYLRIIVLRHDDELGLLSFWENERSGEWSGNGCQTGRYLSVMVVESR
jgi:hypothetical protein